MLNVNEIMKFHLSNLTNSELLQLLTKSNSQAFEEIFNRYWKRLFSYAYKIYNEEKVCEDIVQEVFISLWKNKKTNILNLEAYLFKAVKYKIASHIRDLKFTNEQLDILQQLPANISNNLEYQELETKIFEEIEKLPPKCKKVFKLSRLENKSNQEIAQTLNLSIRTVETHISNALKYLRNQLPVLEIGIVFFGIFI